MVPRGNWLGMPAIQPRLAPQEWRENSYLGVVTRGEMSEQSTNMTTSCLMCWVNPAPNPPHPDTHSIPGPRSEHKSYFLVVLTPVNKFNHSS